MEVQVLRQNLYKKYDAFLIQHEGCMFYHSTQYKDFLEKLLNCESHYLLAIDNNEIHGVLPLIMMNGKYGFVINSLPFYGSHGGIVAKTQNALLTLTQAYNDLLDQPNIAAATLVSNPFFEVDYTHLKYDLIDKRIGQWINLPNNIANLLTQFDSSARRNIKKAINAEISVAVDNDAIDFLQTTHNQNMQSIGGIAKSNAFFKIITEIFEPNKNYKIFVAKKNDTYIAALLLFYFKDFVEYFTPVIQEEYRDKQPLALIIHEATKDAIDNGYKIWNWGGTWITQDSVYRFKKKWASLDKEYAYYVKINNKQLFSSTREELLKEYPNFFVIPFSKLGDE